MQCESFGKYISAIYRHQQILINNKLKPYGIGSGQYIFLINIHNHEGLSQKELSKLLAIDKTTTAKAVRKLEDEGYIYREQDKEDKRYYKLYLTEKGKSFIPTLRKFLRSNTDILSSGMSDKQQEQTLESLKLMLENMCKSVEDLRKKEE
ncbi:MarR family winged helix-turn-helix transcriptional regulator [Oceanirhabdus sp. W0125-5]|uniref:MarR family winged helix-turn-helix transcriptional regulator n=1 Tax=Oceanirhabdus sp. W0125-5 TaxID=2999116 RepID=UPI0022F31D95|nr:MarR family transcriptional regulator [Oceanirhabdus sp. W0125-5]WBW97213.1 MarR family transcriptional regulator [Oceanirhabdus sp. W0125-5]